MPTKIETSLSPEELMEFFRRCAQTKGGGTGPAIQALASEFGVTISHDSANTFRKTALKEYLDELAATARMADDVAELGRAGAGMADGAASAFAAKVFDAARKLDPDEIGGKKANNLSLAISRLRSGDQRARYLETIVAEKEQKMELQQFDAAKAVLEHAEELRLIVSDNKLDQAAKVARVRARLFGTAPADFKPVDQKGEASE